MAASFIDGGILGSWRKPQVTGKLYSIKPQVTGKLYHIKLYQVHFHHRAEITMTQKHTIGTKRFNNI